MEVIDYASKTNTLRNYFLGSVTINKKDNIKLNPQYYSKRKRIFTATKPSK